MKRQTIMAMQLAFACMFLLSLNSCLKDNCSRTYTIYRPVYKTLAEVRADMKSNAPREIESPGKIYLYGNYIFLNDQQQGIHVIDNSQPTKPRNIAFINIPGCADMAVKGSTLYADSHGDLVTFDISNPLQVVAKKFLNNVFPHRAQYYIQNGTTFNPDSIQQVAGWTRKDTTVDCDTYRRYYDLYYASSRADAFGNYAAPQVGGIGGSMARFTLMNNYLYTVTNTQLKTFDISNPQNPEFKTSLQPGNWTIETIYPFKNRLFIGTMSGMYVYDATNGSNPTLKGQFEHARSCDPVVADDNYAYVTLRSGTQCQGFTNQLDVVGIANLDYPTLTKTYQMTNPHGLSKDGNLLFICDGKDGLKVYDASNVTSLKLLKHLKGMETYDVIAWNKIALVVAKEGLYQFDYTNANDIRLISTINLKKF
jgi:hypothetical protein